MSKKLLIIILSLLAIQPSFSQSEHIKWSASPSLHNLSESEKEHSAIVLEDFRFHEYREGQDKNMYVFCEQRRLIKVNDLKGVEMFNKIYVYMGDNFELVSFKARTITPQGKVIEVPASKLIDFEEEGSRYKKIAMEGVETGAEIEYYTQVKKNLSTFGLETFSLSSAPVKHASFALAVPDHLVFDVRGYNGFKVSPDTVMNSKRYISAEALNTPLFEQEKYASTQPYNTNIQYKLSYNLAKDKQVKMNTWSQLATNVYSNYGQLSEKELKSLKNYYKKMGIPTGISKEQQIAMIEDYVKTNLNIVKETLSDGADEIDNIIKSKVAGQFGLARFLIGLYKVNALDPVIVFPSKRDETPLDETFENYMLVSDALLYFPSVNGYLDPVNPTLRFPVITPTWGGTKGLFIKETSLGSYKTAIAEFDSIPLLPYDQNFTNMEVSIRLNNSLDTMMLTSKQMLSGYSASVYRPAYAFLEKDKQDEFTRDVINSVAKSDSIIRFSVENQKMSESYKNLPLNIYGELISVELVERAGRNVLIKFGELIGPQAQMYQEKKRQLPIMIDYPHALDRVLNFTIPAGYKIKNLSDLEFNITDKKVSGTETMGFISKYELKGQELKVSVHEFYKEIGYDISRIGIFRDVINAAADFNKVVLVLEEIK